MDEVIVAAAFLVCAISAAGPAIGVAVVVVGWLVLRALGEGGGAP